MYINLRLFAKALYLSLFKRRFSLRRWAYIWFFTALYWVMWLIVAFGRGLDHILFPGFRRQPVTKPVFIVAPPRSGTTLTQKLMSLDDERFLHVKLYQTIFPSVFFQRCFDGVAWIDLHTGQPLSRFVGWFEKTFFGGWDDMHKLRLNQPEEDDGFFVYSFVTEAIYLLFPHVDELWEAGFPDALPAEDRRKLMRYYRSCLQRHLYANGPDKTLLSKATQSSGAVDSLREAFPDARFITIIRHPYESVASHVSVFYPVWRAHSPDIAKDSPVSKAYARLALRWYQHLFEFGSKMDPARYYCMDYRDLTRNPREAIGTLYQHFGWGLSDAFHARLKAATERQRTFKSAHHYTLEEFGLSKAWIQEELGPLLDHYSLAR
jgi:omega-hydroxy-beta-dihydromenaquinone-9 sulfotransferase